MYIYIIIIAYLLYIYAQIIFISSIFVRLFVHHHLKHIFMNHSYCFDETPLGQVTQVTRRYCRTWRLTPFSSSAVRLGDDGCQRVVESPRTRGTARQYRGAFWSASRG